MKYVEGFIYRYRPQKICHTGAVVVGAGGEIMVVKEVSNTLYFQVTFIYVYSIYIICILCMYVYIYIYIPTMPASLAPSGSCSGPPTDAQLIGSRGCRRLAPYGYMCMCVYTYIYIYIYTYIYMYIYIYIYREREMYVYICI